MTEDTRDYRRMWSSEVAEKVRAQAQVVELRQTLEELRNVPAAWLQVGIEAGWLAEPFCYVHGEPDLTEEEALEVSYHDGDLDAICFPAVRFLP